MSSDPSAQELMSLSNGRHLSNGRQFNIRLPSATIETLDRLAAASHDPQRIGTPRQQLLIRLIEHELLRRLLTEPTA